MIESPSYGSTFEFESMGNALLQGDSYFSLIPYGTNNLVMKANFVYRGILLEEAPDFYSEISGMEGTGYFNCGNTLSGIYQDVDFFHDGSSFAFEAEGVVSANVSARTDQESQILNWKGCYVQTGDIPQIAEGLTFSKGDIMIGLATTGSYPLNKNYYRWATEDFTVTAEMLEDDAAQYTSTTYPFDLEYPIQVQVKPRVRRNEFKNSVYSRHKVGSNQLTWENLQISFRNLTDSQARAMLMYLENRHGIERIELSLPDPYNKITKYVAPNWTHTMVSYDVNNIEVTFNPDPRFYYD